LTVTLETDDGAQRYEGIVPIAGERLADSLQVYFENSEQLADTAVVACRRVGRLRDAAAATAGRMTGSRPRCGDALRPPPIDDAWRRVQLIGDTLTPEELRPRSRTRRFCIGCSTRTMSACSSRRPCIFAADVRASAWRHAAGTG
jgi:redox-regulated HSP33 family molecular chaperone